MTIDITLLMVVCLVAAGSCTGYSTDRGPVCYSCSDHAGDCTNTTICGHDEVCLISRQTHSTDNEKRYLTKCENKKVCYDEMNLIQLILMSNPNPHECFYHCCTDDLCNSNCSSSSNSSSVDSTTAPPTMYYCMSNPCVHGACVENNDKYTCNCYAGASGQRCEITLTTFPIATATSPARPAQTTTNKTPTTTAEMTTTATTTAEATTTTTPKSTTTAPHSCKGYHCLNGGKCIMDHHTVHCLCRPDHTGDHCQEQRHCQVTSNLHSFIHNNQHFTFIQHKMSHSEAFTYCKTHCLGTLVQVKTYDKYQTLHGHLRHSNLHGEFYIDGTYNHHTGHWETSDGQRMTENHHAWVNEDLWGKQGDCVRFRSSDAYQLNDIYCDQDHGLICEYYL